MLPKTLCNDTFSNSIGTKLDIRHKNFEILSTVGMFGSVFGVSYCQVVQSRVWTCLHRCNKFLTFNIRGDNWWLLSRWLFLVSVGLLWGAQFLLWLGFVKFVLSSQKSHQKDKVKEGWISKKFVHRRADQWLHQKPISLPKPQEQRVQLPQNWFVVTHDRVCLVACRLARILVLTIKNASVLKTLT